MIDNSSGSNDVELDANNEDDIVKTEDEAITNDTKLDVDNDNNE